jgi:hypothetical protein
VRTIDSHHDGHGLNESLEIVADEADKSGASHGYTIDIVGPQRRHQVARIQYQQGPRNEETSTPGVTEAAMLAILIDRLKSFQSGPYPCRENAIILTKLEECMMWTKERAHERARRGVLGSNAK